MEIEKIKPISNHVLIKIGPENDRIVLTGGLELFIDNSYEETAHATVVGEVIAVPDKLVYGNINPMSIDWKTKVEIRPGDIVWYHFMEYFKAVRDERKLIKINNERYIFIRYDQIFVAKRKVGEYLNEKPDGRYSHNMIFENNTIYKVIMLNGYILTEPEKEKEKSIIIINPNIVDNHRKINRGKVAFTGSCNDLYYEMDNKNKLLVKPGDVDNVNVGDTVGYQRNCNIFLENKMHAVFNEGKMYYRIQRKHIHVIIN